MVGTVGSNFLHCVSACNDGNNYCLVKIDHTIIFECGTVYVCRGVFERCEWGVDLLYIAQLLRALWL